jgi:hypothetical protein
MAFINVPLISVAGRIRRVNRPIDEPLQLSHDARSISRKRHRMMRQLGRGPSQASSRSTCVPIFAPWAVGALERLRSTPLEASRLYFYCARISTCHAELIIAVYVTTYVRLNILFSEILKTQLQKACTQSVLFIGLYLIFWFRFTEIHVSKPRRFSCIMYMFLNQDILELAGDVFAGYSYIRAGKNQGFSKPILPALLPIIFLLQSKWRSTHSWV